MDFNYVVSKRRSIREYQKNHPVEKEKLVEMIKAAQKAPSWKNSQTARYYVVMDPEKVEALKADALPGFNQNSSKDAPVLIVCAFVKKRAGFTREGEAEDVLGDGWGCLDLGLSLENMLLKAEEQGLGTLIMGIRDAEVIRERLQIPEDQEIGPVIAVGYTDAEPTMPKRKNVEDMTVFF